MEFKNEETNAVFYRTPSSFIQTHEKNIKQKKKINVEVENDVQT